MKSRGVITFAVGSPQQIRKAKALARSLMLHDPTVMRAIITDSTDRELGELFTYQVQYRPGYGPLDRQKLFLDRYTPFQETLFLDNACLAIRNLDAFWKAFHDVPFGVCGTNALRRGEKHPDLDLPFLLDFFHLASIPAFSGAAYYFKRSPRCNDLFETARDLCQRAAELRLVTREDGIAPGAPSDAAVFSIAMAMHGLSGTDMGTGGMCAAIDSTTHLDLDVIRGICHLAKRGRIFTPDVFHAGNFDLSFPYLRECSRLEHQARGLAELSRAEHLQLVSKTALLWGGRKARKMFTHIPPPFPPAPRLTVQH